MTDNLYWENERNANKYVAKCLFVMAVVGVLLWILNLIGVFIVNHRLMNIGMAACTFFLLLPSFMEKRLVHFTPWVKYLYLCSVITGLGILSATLTMHTVLAWAIPIVLSCHYYSGKFTLRILAGSLTVMSVSYFAGLYWGLWDNNVMRALGGTVVRNVTPDILKRGLIFYVIPRSLILSAIAPICYTLVNRTRMLIAKQAALTEENNRVTADLNVAAQIQRDMLPCTFPAFPEREDMDIGAFMQPAREVGGDFYDFFLVNDNHMGFLIGDVSGKGVPAALFMVIAKTLLKNHLQSGLDPANAFEAANRQLCENNKADMFVTAWAGVADLEGGQVCFVNAGHNPPLLLGRDGRSKWIKSRPDLALAAMDGISYHNHFIQVSPGEQLFLYTDGITEAMNPGEELYGEARLETTLNGKAPGRAFELIDRVAEDVFAFAGDAPQFDDMTMLVFERKGKEAKGLS